MKRKGQEDAGRAAPARAGRLITTGLLCGALGLAAGTALQSRIITRGNAAVPVAEMRERGTRFVRPLLECDRPRESTENRSLLAVQRRVEAVIRDNVSAGKAGHISVYFRDLNVGTWFSVNPTDRFVPASLLKVPVLIALLRETGTDPLLLQRQVRYAGTEDLAREQSVQPGEPLAPGAVYSVGELARRMVVHSDNNAARLVLDSLPEGALDRVYDDLNVAFSGTRGDESFISVDAYAMVFRILYNGTYLDRRSNEAALSLLAQRAYRGGLRGGVPADVPLAAKFGEWRLREDVVDREQLHDCGIVYTPSRPYLLCVMTRGPRAEPLEGVIAAVSRAVYEQFGSDAAPEAFAGLSGFPDPSP